MDRLANAIGGRDEVRVAIQVVAGFVVCLETITGSPVIERGKVVLGRPGLPRGPAAAAQLCGGAGGRLSPDCRWQVFVNQYDVVPETPGLLA